MCGDRMGIDVRARKGAKKREASEYCRFVDFASGMALCMKKYAWRVGVVCLLLLGPETFLGFGEETELF